MTCSWRIIVFVGGEGGVERFCQAKANGEVHLKSMEEVEVLWVKVRLMRQRSWEKWSYTCY